MKVKIRRIRHLNFSDTTNFGYTELYHLNTVFVESEVDINFTRA